MFDEDGRMGLLGGEGTVEHMRGIPCFPGGERGGGGWGGGESERWSKLFVKHRPISIYAVMRLTVWSSGGYERPSSPPRLKWSPLCDGNESERCSELGVHWCRPNCRSCSSETVWKFKLQGPPRSLLIVWMTLSEKVSGCVFGRHLIVLLV